MNAYRDRITGTRWRWVKQTRHQVGDWVQDPHHGTHVARMDGLRMMLDPIAHVQEVAA